ncbi:hypothetical protein D3C71_1947780 [compost metagenome]
MVDLHLERHLFLFAAGMENGPLNEVQLIALRPLLEAAFLLIGEGLHQLLNGRVIPPQEKPCEYSRSQQTNQ